MSKQQEAQDALAKANEEHPIAYGLFSIFVLVAMVAAVIGAFVLISNHQTDQYCKTTPLDRIDRERCGIQEAK